MLNEGIDIENETAETKQPFLTSKQVGRMLTEVGIEDITDDMNGLIVDSTKVEDNRKNV